MPTVEVLRAGALTTVQDQGRPGWGRFGVSPSGAVDPLALRVANILVGNEETAAALEITGPGVVLKIYGQALLCIVGADLGATLSGQPVAPGQRVLASDRQILAFTNRRQGFRAIVAFAGGLSAPGLFGSRATDIAAGLPRGRLEKGAMLEVFAPAPGSGPVRPPALGDGSAAVIEALFEGLSSAPSGAGARAPLVVRFVPEDGGPVLMGRTFTVSHRSNRTGFRLHAEGEALPPRPALAWSNPVAPGAIQLPPDGAPIVLLADRQTVGGYPVLGHLAAVDRTVLAGAAPGDRLRFEAISAEAAREQAAERHAMLTLLSESVVRRSWRSWA